MTPADFRERTAEAWFDPAGLFLAPTTTPRRPVTRLPLDQGAPDEKPTARSTSSRSNPKAAGRGIGKVLTNAGLHHLAALGLPTVILYVDGDNAPAIAVYDGAASPRARTEAQYRGAEQTREPGRGSTPGRLAQVPSAAAESRELSATALPTPGADRRLRKPWIGPRERASRPPTARRAGRAARRTPRPRRAAGRTRRSRRTPARARRAASRAAARTAGGRCGRLVRREVRVVGPVDEVRGEQEALREQPPAAGLAGSWSVTG